MTAIPHNLNHLGQPIGPPIPDWKPPLFPPREPMEGRFCRVEPLDPGRHAESLSEAFSLDTEGRTWTYLPYGPFPTRESYKTWLVEFCTRKDPMFHAIIELASGKALGAASYSRIDPSHGTIEVGHITYSPLLQRTPAATEAMYLMMRRVFELGYRRYEWKCDSLNAKSRAAARRLGFSYEGIFRQATTYKGRSRDTAWFAVIDSDWPMLKNAFERWLDPGNFGGGAKQKIGLSELTAPVLNNPA